MIGNKNHPKSILMVHNTMNITVKHTHTTTIKLFISALFMWSFSFFIISSLEVIYKFYKLYVLIFQTLLIITSVEHPTCCHTYWHHNNAWPYNNHNHIEIAHLFSFSRGLTKLFFKDIQIIISFLFYFSCSNCANLSDYQISSAVHAKLQQTSATADELY